MLRQVNKAGHGEPQLKQILGFYGNNMTHFVNGLVRTLMVGMAALTFTTVATAQMRSGARMSTPQMSAAWWNAQALAGNRLSSFYYRPSPYGNMYGYPSNAGSGYGSSSGGGYGGSYGGGYGGSSSGAPPLATYQGAAVQPANSGTLQDDIARQQANYQGSSENLDLMERRLQFSKAAFEEALREKLFAPAPETVREELRQQRLVRARNSPPAAEIASGQSLNELLANIQRLESRQVIVGASIPLDTETVARLNVTTTGDRRGSNELFKDGAFSKWPSLLSGENFAAERKEVQAALTGGAPQTANVAKSTEARRLVERMREKLSAGRFDATFTDYVSAIEFLNKLTDAANILPKQDAANYSNGAYKAQGNTVSQLVKHMNMNGLTFTKAAAGDEPYYSKLYQLVVAYEIDLSRQAEQQSATQVRTPAGAR
jgi:hypothetical protein